MRRLRALIGVITKLIYLLGLLAGAAVRATPLVFQSTERHTALLELYTSEGCSSCPPAEAWISKLKGDPGLWTGFVPVAFHVDYWDNLGWRDRLSSAQYTKRQQDYARAWSMADIYTPEFVLNGKEWHNWFGWRGAPGSTASGNGVVRASSVDGKHWEANFVPAKDGTTDYEVTAALLVSDFGSNIGAGENSGLRLNHDFAVLSLITRPLTLQTNGMDGQFIIDPSPKGISGRLALAIWVTRSGQLEPLQATGGWLSAPDKQ